jgi:hypothetical protein
MLLQNGQKIVNIPASTKEALFINTTLAHGRSAIQPAITLPKAFESPMIENTRGTRSEWYVIFNDLINSDRKKNGIKKPEKKN